jgi:hypothetical protein
LNADDLAADLSSSVTFFSALDPDAFFEVFAFAGFAGFFAIVGQK